MTGRPVAGEGGVAVVGMCASAGGLAALATVLRDLPADLPAAIAVVLHLEPRHESHLAAILGRRTALQVKEALPGETMQPGVVYVAGPDRHLVAGPEGVLEASTTPPVNFVRPSADVLLTSLAERYGSRTLAVVLTGSGRDGAQGASDVRRLGGTVVVQDRESSAHFGMPGAAIAAGAAELVLPLEEIGPAVLRLVRSGPMAA